MGQLAIQNDSFGQFSFVEKNYVKLLAYARILYLIFSVNINRFNHFIQILNNPHSVKILRTLFARGGKNLNYLVFCLHFEKLSAGSTHDKLINALTPFKNYL